MPYVTHVSINLCQYHIENIGGYFYLQIMKLQNQNQVRGASDPEKLFTNSNTERKKRVQSSNQVVQFPDSFLYFRIQQPRNSFILWEREENWVTVKNLQSVSSVLVLSSQLHTKLMMNIEHNTHDDSKVLKYSTFHALLLVVALWFFGKLRSKAKKKAPGPVNNVYRKKVWERELGVNLYGVWESVGKCDRAFMYCV